MLAAIISVVVFCSTQVAAATVYLAGDSTMAPGGGGNGTDGWGQYLGQYMSLPVVNKAIAGTSARSFTETGDFANLISLVVENDWVVIEFGHNDGTAGAVDNGRQDAVGDAYNLTSVVTTSNGTQITIHTFDYYIVNAVNAIKAKGATAIVSSQTPDNIWTGSEISAPSRFVQYALEVAGNTSSTYINHFGYVAQAYEAIGETTVNTYYPMDHTHTSPTGANVVAEAFVRGLLCSSSTLKSYVNAKGTAAPNGCL